MAIKNDLSVAFFYKIILYIIQHNKRSLPFIVLVKCLLTGESNVLKLADVMKKICSITIMICIAGCQPKGDVKRDTRSVMTDIITQDSLSKKEQLGKLLFFEKSISTPPGQDCSFCHDPASGFADPDRNLPVSRGARSGIYGTRNDMTVAYAAYIPPLQYDQEEGIWVGGLFWDGRANNLFEQAAGPPLNPLEMANPDTITIAESLRKLDYADLFTDAFGPGALTEPGQAFAFMLEAIVAYEQSDEVSPFNSKYDLWLNGEAELTESEMHGLQLFLEEDKGNCGACHPTLPAVEGAGPLFTDYTYDNLGVPKNPENPFYLLPEDLNPDGFDFVDLGLGETVMDPDENGKFRVPTLRNVAITSPYMHNGVFKTLFQVIAFYNTRDIAPWPAPEVSENINTDEMGNLQLTNQEIEDLVAFLHTLTDGWVHEDPDVQGPDE